MLLVHKHLHCFPEPLCLKHESDATSEALSHINKKLNLIMSAIAEFAARVEQHQATIDTAVEGLSGDIKGLNDKIAELQNTPGAITAEDQALLDQIEQRATAIATKVKALDAVTPPTAPE